MKTPNIKRIGALLCAALQISVSPYALAECYTATSGSSSGGLTGVFSVMKDGTISGLTTNTECNIKFYSSDLLGAQTLPLGGKIENGKNYNCQSYTYNSTTSSFTNTTVGASGTYAAPITLGDYTPSTGQSGGKNFYGEEKTLEAGEWATVSIDAIGGKGSNVTLSNGVKIKTLTMSGCSNGSTLTLLGGTTVYIDELSWPAGCKLVVSGAGIATLNILGTSSSNVRIDGKPGGSLNPGVTANGVTFNGGPTCINYSDAACRLVTQGGWQNNLTAKQAYDYMNNEDPKNLLINVYHGTAHTQGQLAIAAGIYVAEGNLDLQNGTSTTIVGQVVAKNISGQNNSGSSFFAKTSSLDSKYQTPAVNLSKYSDYSLAAAAVSAEVDVAKKNGKVFLAIQRDGTTDTQGNSVAGLAGDLVVYGLNDDGSYNKTGAVYASSKTAKWADKYAKIYTDKASNLSLIGDEKALLSTYAKGLAANAIFARPWRTAPALVDSTGSAAFFATDDGVLYSVKADGTLNWGWMPSDIATVLNSKLLNANATTISAVVSDFHPWGQLRAIKNGDTLYITGTALGGGLHFALKTNSDGSAVPSIGFLDYRAGKTSPGGEAYTSTSAADTWLPLFLKTSTRSSWPFGGDAPVASATGVFDGKVAYIVDKKLVVRQINATGSVSGSGSINASSNLLYWAPGVLFVGSASGELLQLDESGSSTKIEADNGSWGTLSSPVLGIQGAITNGGGKLLLAQTWTGVYAATWDSTGWKKPWYTKAGGSSSSTDPTVPPLPDGAMLTTLPAIAPFDSSIKNNLTGSVLIAYTAGSVASKTTCSNGDVSAWTFGPLLGNTGTQAAAKMGAVGSEQKTDRALAVRTGPGEATGLSLIIFKVNGESYVGMENTASGMGETHADKAVQQGTAPDLSKIPDGGASGDATWTKTTPPAARLNWRELTNFY